ncbi:MAG TPA: hypothetical protein VFU25_11415, partial [Ornithinibacter sp.]|nr:hypothetical protein [Ornithinibacter sp.]
MPTRTTSAPAGPAARAAPRGREPSEQAAPEPVASTVPAVPALDVDVLVVGAGISGVDAACRLAKHCP